MFSSDIISFNFVTLNALDFSVTGKRLQVQKRRLIKDFSIGLMEVCTDEAAPEISQNKGVLARLVGLSGNETRGSQRWRDLIQAAKKSKIIGNRDNESTRFGSIKRSRSEEESMENNEVEHSEFQKSEQKEERSSENKLYPNIPEEDLAQIAEHATSSPKMPIMTQPKPSTQGSPLSNKKESLYPKIDQKDPLAKGIKLSPEALIKQVARKEKYQAPKPIAPNVPSTNAHNVPSSSAPNVPSSNAPKVPSSNAPKVPSSNAPNIPSSNAPNVPSSTASTPPSALSTTSIKMKPAENSSLSATNATKKNESNSSTTVYKDTAITVTSSPEKSNPRTNSLTSVEIGKDQTPTELIDLNDNKDSSAIFNISLANNNSLNVAGSSRNDNMSGAANVETTAHNYSQAKDFNSTSNEAQIVNLNKPVVLPPPPTFERQGWL